jgi:hypothetical protein
MPAMILGTKKKSVNELLSKIQRDRGQKKKKKKKEDPYDFIAAPPRMTLNLERASIDACMCSQ